MPAVGLLQREMLTTSKMDAHKRNEVDMGNSTPEDLARSESEQLVELQAAALKAAPNAIVITDRGAKIVWVNNAFEQLTGYSSQEVVGQSTRLLQSGQHSPSFYTNLWDTILSGSRWQGALVNRRKDGTLYSEEMSITPVRDRAGDITHFVAIKRDITESKNSEREPLWTVFSLWTRQTRSSSRTSASQSCGVCRQRWLVGEATSRCSSS